MHVYFIRHGESVGNREGKIQGSMNFPLTEEGERQARAVAKRFRQLEINQIYSSDLDRAFITATEIANEKEMTVIPWQQLREVHLGPFQGLSKEAILTNYPEVKEHQLLTSAVEGTETIEQLTERCKQIMKHLHTSHQQERIAIVAHGGLISILLMYLLTGENWHQFYRPFQIGNTSVTHIEWKEAEFPLIHYINDTNHLS